MMNNVLQQQRDQVRFLHNRGEIKFDIRLICMYVAWTVTWSDRHDLNIHYHRLNTIYQKSIQWFTSCVDCAFGHHKTITSADKPVWGGGAMCDKPMRVAAYRRAHVIHSVTYTHSVLFCTPCTAYLFSPISSLYNSRLVLYQFSQSGGTRTWMPQSALPPRPINRTRKQGHINRCCTERNSWIIQIYFEQIVTIDMSTVLC